MSAVVHDVGGTDGLLRLVGCTFPDAATAERVSEAALASRLAACVNRFPVSSRYHWKGRLESAEEVLVLFKTTPRKVGALFAQIARAHPYEVPDLFELAVARAHPPFLEYLAATLERGLPVPPGRPGRPRAVRRRGARPAPGARALPRTRARRPRR